MGLFYGLSFMDRPTLIIVHEFTNPLIDQIGSLGNALGKGETLVLIALGTGAIGLGLKSPTWKFAGLYMLLAHGLSGLTTQLLKHSLSRPRPRLMETVPWNVGFSLESGWDSFPSGHTSASFSVATVLAYYFPGGRMLWFGLAGYVGLSRVITGAHFPTDVLGGMLVGIGSGLVLVYARDQWKKVTIRAFVHGLPWLVIAYGMLWVLVPHSGMELAPDISLFLGSMFVMTGLGLRLLWIREGSRPHSSAEWSVPTWPRVLMGVGLASSTGSLVIIGASLTAGIIWWMGNQTYTSKMHNRSILVLNPLWTEATWGIAMFFTTLLIFSIRSQLLLF
jgi:membrane-associated phospholipid phosphatase